MTPDYFLTSLFAHLRNFLRLWNLCGFKYNPSYLTSCYNLDEVSALALLTSSLNPRCAAVFFLMQGLHLCSSFYLKQLSKPSWFLSTVCSPRWRLFHEVLLDCCNPVIQRCSLLDTMYAMSIVFICLWFYCMDQTCFLFQRNLRAKI